MSVDTCTCMWLSMSRPNGKVLPSTFLKTTIYLCKVGFLIDLELNNYVRQNDLQVPKMLLSLLPQNWNYKLTNTHVLLFLEFCIDLDNLTQMLIFKSQMLSQLGDLSDSEITSLLCSRGHLLIFMVV